MSAGCEWKEDPNDFFWETSCGNRFIFECGSPSENRFVYCPYCGRRISEKEERFGEVDERGTGEK